MSVCLTDAPSLNDPNYPHKCGTVETSSHIWEPGITCLPLAGGRGGAGSHAFCLVGEWWDSEGAGEGGAAVRLPRLLLRHFCKPLLRRHRSGDLI